MATLAKLWLVAEDGDDDFLLLQRACTQIRPRPQLQWVKDGLEAQCYLAGSGRFADRHSFPLPDLILSDVKMPQLNGFELLAWVKTQPSLESIPFVVLSSSPLERDRDRADKLGADRYLVKEPNPAALSAALHCM
jgi:CheY-like chemotaxis protein